MMFFDLAFEYWERLHRAVASVYTYTLRHPAHLRLAWHVKPDLNAPLVANR